MAFTGKLGISDSKLENIQLGKGATALPFNLFSGLYKIVPGKTNDTLFIDINYPSYSTAIVEIPNPFVETALIGEDPVALD